MDATILIVDDEESIVELIDYNLRRSGLHTITAFDGETAVRIASEMEPDLILLDLMLPDLDGFEVCRRIRRTSHVPILFLSARDEDMARIFGMELGADDYLTKPFNPEVLVARVRAALRRLAVQPSPEEPAALGQGAIQVGDLVIDEARHEVRVGERLVELTPREFDLLLCLASHAGLVMTRQTLLDRIWDTDYYGDPRTVDVHVKHLRDKLGPMSTGRSYITTVRGVGYKVEP